jgi:hypothetical protein
MNKTAWLDLFELIDASRIVPRIVLGGFAVWTIYIFDVTLHWYFTQPAVERSVQDAGMVTALLSAITGLFTLVVKFYVNSGRQWSGESSVTTTATRSSS